MHTSNDGMTWDNGHRPVLFTLNKVIYANGEFLAVGNTGTIVTSTNAVDWTVQSSGATNDLYAVAFGNGRFVACGVNGQVVVSTNGSDWEAETNGSIDLSWVTFGNGLFMVAGPGVTVNVSSDGETWTNIGLPVNGADWPHNLYQVEFGNGKFVAVMLDEISYGEYSLPASHFYASVDGTNWVQKDYINQGPGQAFNHRFLVFLNGAFHELTSYASYPNQIVPINITLDGSGSVTTYAPTNAPAAQSMAYGNGKYLLIEQSGKSWVSTDETNWTAAYSGSQADIDKIIQGNGNIVAVGPMLISTDGVHFSGPYNPSDAFDPLYAAAFDGTNYVTAGGYSTFHSGNGVVYTSTNGMDWVQRTSNADEGLSAVCHGASRWVAVGANGTLITSPNTLAWTLRSSGTANDLNAITYGGGIYVAVGNGGTVITSPDGATWDVQFSGTVNNLNQVIFQNGQFMAVGSGGTILTSPDGANWTSQTSGTVATLWGLAYGDGGYLAGGPDDTSNPSAGQVFLTSTNGTNWQNVSTKIPTTTLVRSIDYVNQSFWIVGANGMILQSDVADGIPRLAGSMIPGNAGMKLSVTLNPSASYRVQFRTNLLTDIWRDIYVQTNAISSDTWTDTNAVKSPGGFYRIASP
ncbi:MAG TPA: hypothetical protein VG938_08205 [Verrucomicrobiae bacterium]|nr:hypothetical protein [Verrucomicrobiae bacterium]